MTDSLAYNTLTEHLDLSVWPKRWLKLAVLSLALAGIFSIILVISRTPQLITLVPAMKDLFQVSLVVHVDLSVLVWFLAMTAMLWSIQHYHSRKSSLPLFDAAGWVCMLAGTLLIALSPVSGEWDVIKSNYIPVITNLLFFVGLALVMASLVISLLNHLRALPVRDATVIVGWGIYASMITTCSALVCFAASAALIPHSFSGVAFYEHLFWAGGHVLQFTYMQSMLVAWVLLAQALGYRLMAGPMQVMVLLAGPFFTLISFVPYLFFGVDDQEHMEFFTLQMKAILGIGAGVMGIWLAWQMIRIGRDKVAPLGNAIRYCLGMSLVLFFAGGALGGMIHGSNTQVPAHYHGSIVAVTLALMGLAYLLLPRMGYREVAGCRMARMQPWIYGIGQLMHISGLAYSGGYGVLRKTAGDVGDGSADVMVALGVMGTGGLLAIIGGLLFVIVMVKGFRRISAIAP